MAQCLWNFVEKLFLNQGLISDLILLGKVSTLNLAIAFGKGLPFFSWLQDQLWKSLLRLWTLRANLLKWIGPSHGPVPLKFCVFFKKYAFNKRFDCFGKGFDFEFGNCFWTRPTFLLLSPGSALEKFAALVNPENEPTKVNWTLSWPSAVEICGKTVL